MEKEFKLSMDFNELEERLKNYFKNMDLTITDIDVNIDEHRTSGQWSEAWQCNLGSSSKLEATVKTIHEINLFGEVKRIENYRKINQKEIIQILSFLVKESGLEVTFICSDLFDETKVNIYCQKIINQEEREKEIAQKEKEEFYEALEMGNYSEAIYYLRNSFERKINSVLKKVYK